MSTSSRLRIFLSYGHDGGEAGRNPLVEMLARHAPRLPDWIGLVGTSRRIVKRLGDCPRTPMPSSQTLGFILCDESKQFRLAS